jgi:hypothetical protein
MHVVEVELLPEDYLLFMAFMGEIKAGYNTPVLRTQLGIKLGKLLRAARNANITC